jgi:hypothetical protein
MYIGFNEKDIYHQNEIENLLEDDEISSIEAAFMEGYNEAF